MVGCVGAWVRGGVGPMFTYVPLVLLLSVLVLVLVLVSSEFLLSIFVPS